MFMPTMDVVLSADDLRLLRSMIRSTTLGAGLVRRARVLLAVHAGQSYAAIGATQGVTDKFIAQWKRRVAEGSVLALGDAPRSGRRIGWIHASKRRSWPARRTRRPPR